MSNYSTFSNTGDLMQRIPSRHWKEPLPHLRRMSQCLGSESRGLIKLHCFSSWPSPSTQPEVARMIPMKRRIFSNSWESLAIRIRPEKKATSTLASVEVGALQQVAGLC